MPEARYSAGIISPTDSTLKYLASNGCAVIALRMAIAASICFCTNS
jgi:hypothetical protein